MGIYITGTDMPKSCSECFADDNGWCNILGCSIGASVALRMIERRRDCPLVEVPPHGRCIDANDLPECDLYDPFWQEHGYSQTIIDNEPTIIPASGGEEADPTDPADPVVSKALKHGFYGTMYGHPGEKVIFIKPGEAWESNGILYFRWGYPGPDVNAYKPEDYGKTWAMMEYELTDSIPENMEDKI